jgi:hypothetical protein
MQWILPAPLTSLYPLDVGPWQIQAEIAQISIPKLLWHNAIEKVC